MEGTIYTVVLSLITAGNVAGLGAWLVKLMRANKANLSVKNKQRSEDRDVALETQRKTIASLEARNIRLERDLTETRARHHEWKNSQLEKYGDYMLRSGECEKELAAMRERVRALEDLVNGRSGEIRRYDGNQDTAPHRPLNLDQSGHRGDSE